MPATDLDFVTSKAIELGTAADADGATEKLVDAAGGDRRTIEAARDRVAAHIHNSVDDWEATAALTLLNRALATMPLKDPFDWRGRNTRFRRP